MKPIVHTFVEGSRAEVFPDGRWDLTLPNGRHVRGQAENVEAATDAVNASRLAYVLSRWEEGRLQAVNLPPRQRFLVPLD
jgi:hypothetical protein